MRSWTRSERDQKPLLSSPNIHPNLGAAYTFSTKDRQEQRWASTFTIWEGCYADSKLGDMVLWMYHWITRAFTPTLWFATIWAMSRHWYWQGSQYWMLSMDLPAVPPWWPPRHCGSLVGEAPSPPRYAWRTGNFWIKTGQPHQPFSDFCKQFIPVFSLLKAKNVKSLPVRKTRGRPSYPPRSTILSMTIATASAARACLFLVFRAPQEHGFFINVFIIKKHVLNNQCFFLNCFFQQVAVPYIGIIPSIRQKNGRSEMPPPQHPDHPWVLA